MYEKSYSGFYDDIIAWEHAPLKKGMFVVLL